MDRDFWLQRWQANEIGFHAPAVQPALIKHWHRLGLPAGARVLVPLCGKSLDMPWLAERHCGVVGVELSELALTDFLAAHQRADAHVRHAGDFKIFVSPPYELYCGDFFALDAATANVTAAYDRAALVAMPPDMQPRYADKLAELIPPSGKVLLIGLDYNQAEISGPPFAVSTPRLHELLGHAFEIEVLGTQDGLAKAEHLQKRGLTRLEEATYLLTRRA